jgi:hypothetical protein
MLSTPVLKGANSMKKALVKSAIEAATGLCVSTRGAAHNKPHVSAVLLK